MMRAFFTTVYLGAAMTTIGEASIERIANSGERGTAASVRVGDVPLVFTGQIMAPQADAAIDELAAVLERSGSDLGRVVRLNAYVAASDKGFAAVEAAIAARFSAAPPATTILFSPATHSGSNVSFDAVAETSRAVKRVEIVSERTAILPQGGKLFISGQAVEGADLASSVRLTMVDLFRTLAHAGLSPKDVVQVRAFIQPFAGHIDAARTIASAFDGAPVPPLVLVEWQHRSYAEIELIAAAGSASPATDAKVSFTFLPWMKPSPVYSHATLVTAGTPLIFIGSINGRSGEPPRTQLMSIFEQLGSVLFEAGSSYRHLAKATYFLADQESPPLLAEIRRVYFDLRVRRRHRRFQSPVSANPVAQSSSI